MWGFAYFSKNLLTRTAQTYINTVKHKSYTPIQKIWAHMQTTTLQTSLPNLSSIIIFNLREVLEKAMEQPELPATSIGVSYLVQSSILKGRNVCPIIKNLSNLIIGRMQLHSLAFSGIPDYFQTQNC